MKPKDTTTLTTTEVAEILRVDPRTVRRLVRSGRLPALRLDRFLRFRPDAIDALKAESASGNGHDTA